MECNASCLKFSPGIQAILQYHYYWLKHFNILCQMCIGNNSSKMKQMWDGFLVAMYVFSPGKVRLRKAIYLSQQLTLEFVVKVFKIVIP